jgi:peptidoglycan/LPS O-acetylase OafA/YrhL
MMSLFVYHCWLYSAPDGDLVRFNRIGWLLPYLTFGTTVFLTLSAFLVSYPLLAAVLRAEPLPKFSTYIRGRALRVLPVYWAILLITGVVFQAALVRDGSMQLELGSLIDHPILLVQDLLLVQSLWPDSLLTGIGPAWFLSAVLIFYLIFPAQAALVHRLARRTSSRTLRRCAALTPAGFMLLLGWSGKLLAEYGVPPGPGASPGWDADWHSVLERSLWVQADRFAFGLVVAAIWVEMQDGALVLPRWWRMAAAAAFGVLAPTAIMLSLHHLISDHVYDTLLALIVALLLAVIVLPERIPNRVPLAARVLQVRPLEALGLVSLSFYLWHEPVIRWLNANHLTAPGPIGLARNLVLAAAVAGGLSIATYQLVERRCRRLR